jgi:hypothetical protein
MKNAEWQELTESKLLKFAEEQKLTPEEFMGELSTNLVNMAEYFMRTNMPNTPIEDMTLVFHVIQDNIHTRITLASEPLSQIPKGKIN